MSEAPPYARSVVLMSRHDSALLVIDVQEKLLAAIPAAARVVWNARRLIDAAQCLHVSVAGTEQYPQGLGPTAAVLAERLGPLPEKRASSAAACGDYVAAWRARGIVHVLLAGIEAHVCVQQTAFDLLARGFAVAVAVDAVASRFEIDSTAALRRMESGGVTLTTTEAAMFEWCETAAAAEFKQISRLAREPAP